MRLLHIGSDEKLGWTKDYIGDEKIPPYAILSHTWKEGHELTFDDIENLNDVKNIDAEDKEGYYKIRLCTEQAKRDGLHYFWVDTCCIDKKNSSELQEAINSMFRWYQNASKCYVYLSDVEIDTRDGDRQSSQKWVSTFKDSRWFTRGWTLQELLAPSLVEFFSREGKLLGNKKTLEHIIHEITGIPIKALLGGRLSEFSVAERFSWAENRQTTRGEDEAYCLLGIFDIYMPLLYGEGKKNAVKRLKTKVRESFEDIAGAPMDFTKTPNQSREEWLSKISDWLSPPDPFINYHKAHKQWLAQTGLWLLEGEKFSRWRVDKASRLWLYGIPGCGKTILSSTIIDALLKHCFGDSGMVTAYFYFDFNDTQKQDPELMLRSLLCQLLQHSTTTLKGLDSLFSSYQNGQQQPPLHILLDATRQAIQESTQVYIVLDALDECTQRPKLMGLLRTVAEWQLENLHLILTSRKERDIERSLEEYIDEEDMICLQSDVIDKDIQQYVQQRLSDDKSLAKWKKDAAVKQEIEAALMHGACGMFRWAACQLDTLAKCRNRVMLRKALATLPPTLDQTYDRILCGISEEDSEYAMRILQWLTFSARPLSVKEVGEVIAIDVARCPVFDPDEVLEDPLEVLNICSSLVTIAMDNEKDKSRPAQEIVALAHYSVQEYLVSNRIKQGQARRYSMQAAECHKAITKASLKYLIQIQRPTERFALARYSAEFWSKHLQKTEDEMERLSRLAVSLFSIDNPAYLTWIQLWDPERPWDAPNLEKSLESIATPLYYAAHLGLSTITKLLLAEDADVNTQRGGYGNALQAASYKGSEQVVKNLLEAGAEVNAQSGEYGNALQAASLRGHEQVVKILLEAGAEVNAEGGHYGNALQAASFNDNEQIVKMLLEAGAKVNAQIGAYGNALQAASLRGHEQVVKMLLEADAEVNAQGGAYGNALQAASFDGNEKVVKMLLEAGAEVNAQGGRYGSALQAASDNGNENVIKMLLEAGAQVNSQGGDYGNALQAASLDGNEKVVKMLLEAGAEVNAQGGQYDNALQAASYNGSEQVVKMLLQAGAEVNAQGKEYGNALQAASLRGNERVVEVLLEAGAEVNAQSGDYGNALQAASFDGNEQVVKMLLEAGAKVNVQSGRYGNALQAASNTGSEQVVRVLLKSDAEVNAQGGAYGNALQAASFEGNEQVVKMLLEADAEVNAQGGDYGNALQAASLDGNERVVKMLLDAGAEVNAEGGEYGNALQAASCNGSEQVVKMLLEAGAEVNAQGGEYGSALQAASDNDNEHVVKMLLEAGAKANGQSEVYENALQAA